MDSGKDDYGYLLRRFGRKKVGERFAYLYRKAKTVIDDLGLRKYAYVNEDLLGLAVLDYFADIARIKDFHNIPYTNKYKIKAYGAYWYLRRKPIQLLKGCPTTGQFINEKVAVMLMMCPEKGEVSVNCNTEVLYNLADNLLYYLKFRLVDSQALDLMLTAFHSSSR